MNLYVRIDASWLAWRALRSSYGGSYTDDKCVGIGFILLVLYVSINNSHYSRLLDSVVPTDTF